MRKLILGACATFLFLFHPAEAQTSPKLKFVPVSPCRIKDTRLELIITPLAEVPGGTSRSFPIAGYCGVPVSAKAYSLNITAIPIQPLSYLTLWPTGDTMPFTSLLNSWAGNIVAAAAIVKAGTNGEVSIYTTDPTHIVIDINGYFVESNTDLVFYPLTPCRVFDSRAVASPAPFPAGSTRRMPMRGTCNIPTQAQAYSLNFTVVAPQALGFLTAWPAGQTRPNVSTLNALQGGVVANAAIVPAGDNGAIDVFVTDVTDVIIDVNGYFAPPGAGGLSLYTQSGCRVVDTRAGQGTAGTLGPPSFASAETRELALPAGRCNLPQPTIPLNASAVAYVMNATVVPKQPMAFLSLWPAGLPLPVVSTLNAYPGSVVSNMAIVPGGVSGNINAFVTDPTELILDVYGYFAE